MEKQWKKFDKWWENDGGVSWKDQQNKIEEIFPLTNWKQIWKIFNKIISYLHRFKKYNNWEHEKIILNFLIKEYGDK